MKGKRKYITPVLEAHCLEAQAPFLKDSYNVEGEGGNTGGIGSGEVDGGLMRGRDYWGSIEEDWE